LPVAATVIAVAALIVYSAALSAVYSAAVYRYADGQSPPPGMDESLLSGAFQPKKA